MFVFLQQQNLRDQAPYKYPQDTQFSVQSTEFLWEKQGYCVIVLFYTDKFKNAAILNSSCK